MFSADIVSSDSFLDMPATTQLLYFHLGVRADDDGFITPRVVMRIVGASQDDLKVLIAKRFVLSFDSGVIVIKHWLIHNLIRADLYKETTYKKEKSTLGLNTNGAYTELREGVSELAKIEAPTWLKKRRGEMRTANVPQTAHRLGKDRLGKDSTTSKEREPSAEAVRLATLLYEWRKTNTDGRERKPNINSWAADIDKMIRLDKLQPAEIEYVINWCQQDSFWKQNIKSGNKLRIQYASLYLRIKEQKNGHK